MEKQQDQKVCPYCSSELQIRDAQVKYGIKPFWVCMNPSCEHRENLHEPYIYIERNRKKKRDKK